MVLRWFPTFVAAFSLLAPAAAARAQCTETSVAEGVTLSDCTREGLHWAVVEADLPSVDVGVRVSRPDERRQKIDEWGAMVGNVLVAVQGGPFAFPSYEPLGLTVGDGMEWAEGADDARRTVIAFDARSASHIPPTDRLVAYRAWMQDVVSGVPVLRAGAVVSPCRGQGCERMPRTAIGTANEGRTLVIVVAEGWTDASEGVTDPELGQLALDASATDALRTGEGSTSVLLAGGELTVPSSDGALRETAAFFAITDRGSGATARLRGVAESSEAPLPGAIVAIETIDRRPVVSGPPMTSAGYFEYALPIRDYFVIVSHDGYRTGCKYCPLTMHEMGELWCSAFLMPGSGMETCQAPGFAVDPGGDWPIGSLDAGAPDAAIGFDGGGRPPVDPSCSAAGSGRGMPLSALWIVFALALTARRKVLSLS